MDFEGDTVQLIKDANLKGRLIHTLPEGLGVYGMGRKVDMYF